MSEQDRTRFIDPNSYASDPGQITLSLPQLYKLDPAKKGWGGFFWRLTGGATELKEILRHGDSCAAMVCSVSPLLIAAYSDETDAVIILEFPKWLVEEYQLAVGSKLLTVNVYQQSFKLVTDYLEGEGSTGNYNSVFPIIADFVTDDLQRVHQRKETISEEEWDRCRILGEQSLKRSPKQRRSGIPTKTIV